MDLWIYESLDIVLIATVLVRLKNQFNFYFDGVYIT